MSAKSHKKEYFIVFFLLFVLTVVELWVPEWDASTKLKGGALTFLACVKAFMVAYSFMHLRAEKGWLKFIAAFPIVAGVYFVVVALESFYR